MSLRVYCSSGVCLERRRRPVRKVYGSLVLTRTSLRLGTNQTTFTRSSPQGHRSLCPLLLSPLPYGHLETQEPKVLPSSTYTVRTDPGSDFRDLPSPLAPMPQCSTSSSGHVVLRGTPVVDPQVSPSTWSSTDPKDQWRMDTSRHLLFDLVVNGGLFVLLSSGVSTERSGRRTGVVILSFTVLRPLSTR